MRGLFLLYPPERSRDISAQSDASCAAGSPYVLRFFCYVAEKVDFSISSALRSAVGRISRKSIQATISGARIRVHTRSRSSDRDARSSGLTRKIHAVR